MSPLETLTLDQIVEMRNAQLDPHEKPLRNEVLNAIHNALPDERYRRRCYMTLDEEVKKRQAEGIGPVLVWDRRKQARSDGSNAFVKRDATGTRH